MGRKNQKKAVETTKSRKELRKNKRIQKKANRANFQKRRKEMRVEHKERLKNKTGTKNKQNKSDAAHRRNGDQLVDNDSQCSDADDVNSIAHDDSDEDIASDFELSDEELEMKTNQMTKDNSKSKKAKPNPDKRTQLEEDHQRLLKNEKDLRKQMGKQRINQLKSANEEEDKHIKKLEKLLKINKTKGAKKIPKMFNDGLDYALEMCLPENIEKMYAAAKEAAEAGEDSDEGWQQDLAIVIGQTDEAKPEETESKAEKKKATLAGSKRVERLRKIEKKYFNDSDLDSDLSDVDSEFGDAEVEGMGSNDSDDDAPVEVTTKTRSSAKRILEKAQQRAATTHSHDEDDVDMDSEDDDEEDNESDDGSLSDAQESSAIGDDDLMEDLDAFENGDGSDDDSADGSADEAMDDEGSIASESDTVPTEKPDVWEDIYGRKRDKAGNVIGESEAMQKYIPPHLRARMSAEGDDAGIRMDANPIRREKLMRLRKVLKGYLNRLSEANMHKITTDIDNLYMQNSRHDMNETLTALICDALISNVLSKERMVLEHALLLAALHANIGSEVGAHVLQVLVNKLDEILRQGIENASVEDKTVDNILLILCHMYTFRIFKCHLVYQVLERLSETISEKSVECILLALKSIGFALRKDDPGKLKDLILVLQKKSANASEEVKTNSRLKYMLDILLAIKNNNVNKIPQYDPTIAEHLRKILKSLLVNGKYVITLNISLEDILSADDRGKWWVVGSAWTGRMNPIGGETKSNESRKQVEKFSDKLLELAHKQRMNTEDRRNTFCILMSSEDFVDAFEKLLQLAIQDHTVIVSVIMHCCLAEKKFNPYYAVLAAKFCDYDRKYKLAIQFSIWDRIKDMSLYSNAQLENFAKFVLHLITNGAMPISILKVIEFGELDKPTLRFVRQMLLGILLGDQTVCVDIFQRISHGTKLKVFKDSLRLFMHHFLIKSGQKNGVSAEQIGLIKQRVQLIDKHLNTSIIQF